MSSTDSFEYYSDALIRMNVLRFTVEYNNGMKVNIKTIKRGTIPPEKFLDWYQRRPAAITGVGTPVYPTDFSPDAKYLTLPEWMKQPGVPEEVRVAKIYDLFYQDYIVEDDRFKDLQSLVDQVSRVIPTENAAVREQAVMKLWSLIPQLIRENRLTPQFRLEPYHNAVEKNLVDEIARVKDKEKRRRQRASARRQPVNQR